ncbi:MAG: hypothetical protein H6711_28550 [Myxococcales bacterium]|nr:hypothetical protein [Myxococcales bacterium]
MSLDHQLNELDEILRDFLDQPVDGALVVTCEEVACMLLLHALEELDTNSPGDVVLPLAAAMASVDGFVASTVGGLAASLRGAPNHAELGAAIEDALASQRPPEERLDAVIDAFLGALPPGDHRLVLALVPLQIADDPGCRAMVEHLLQPRPRPRLRLILRDDRQASHVAAEHLGADHPRNHRLDLAIDHAVIADVAQAAARDPSRPPTERASAFLQAGYREIEEGHHAEAEASLAAAWVLAGTPEAALPADAVAQLRAMAGLGLGQAAIALDQEERGRAHLIAAFAELGRLGARAPAALRATIAGTLGRALHRSRELEDAEACLLVGAAAAVELEAVGEVAGIFTELGDVRWSMGQVDEAREAWSTARSAVEALDDDAQLDALDRRLQRPG